MKIFKYLVIELYYAMSSLGAVGGFFFQLEQNLLQRLGVLLQNSPSDFWRNARFIVNTGRQLASHKNGEYSRVVTSM